MEDIKMDDIKLPPPPQPIAPVLAYLCWLVSIAIIVAVVLSGGRS